MRLFSFLHPVLSWAHLQSTGFDTEAEIRILDQDLERLRPTSLRILIAVSAAGTLVGAFQLAAPPRMLSEQIAAIPHRAVSSGEVCLSKDGKPVCKPVHFPKEDKEYLSPANPGAIEYHFEMNRDVSTEAGNLSTLLIPKIWGDTEVYRNDILISKGPNILDAFTLLPGLNRFRIVVTKPSGQKAGIRATHAPIAFTPETAMNVRDKIINETLTRNLTLALQLIIIAILAMFWIWSKNQPELLFFLFLALVEVVKNALLIIYYEKGLALFSPAIDSQIHEVLRSFSVLLAVPFALAVCRVPLRIMTDLPRKFGAHYLGGVLILTIALGSLFKNLPLSSVRTLAFIIASAVSIHLIAVPRLTHMVSKGLSYRFMLTTLTLLGVMVWFGRLTIDLFRLNSGITTEYNNQLLFFVVMAGLLAYQFGRTESRFSLVKSLIAREAVQKVEHPPSQIMRRGFVVLVDIVGWTSKRRRIQSDVDRNQFNQKTLQALFNAFDSPEFSVPGNQGDSVLFTCTSDPTRERFEDIVRRCKALSMDRPTMKQIGVNASEIADEPFIARGTLYYGAYDIVIAESRCHRKEAFSGDAPETCARIIGNDPDPRKVRVVANTALDQFRPTAASVMKAPGKGNIEEPEWLFWEV